MNKFILWCICIIIFSLLSCKENVDEPGVKETGVIAGTVFLENQEEHSNCLIYVDNFNVGYSSDSTGYYVISLADFAPDFTGTLKLLKITD